MKLIVAFRNFAKAPTKRGNLNPLTSAQFCPLLVATNYAINCGVLYESVCFGFYGPDTNRLI
jgi:hypothetical protein